MKRPELDYTPTMPVVLQRAAELFGDDPFVITDEGTTTFADLERRSRQLARRLLAAGVGKATRVGMHLPVGNDWVVAFAAITRIGALAMPCSTLYAPAELERVLRLGDIHLLLAPDVMFERDHTEFLERAVPGLALSRVRCGVRWLQAPGARVPAPGSGWARQRLVRLTAWAHRSRACAARRAGRCRTSNPS